MKKNGFSAIELNLCCAIIAALSVIGYPHFTDLKESAAFNGQVRQLYGGLQLAKFEAIKRNQYVVFKTTHDGFIIFSDDGLGGGVSGDWVQQGGEKTLATHQFPQNVSVIKTTFPSDRVRFDGTVGVKPGRFVLRHLSGARTEVFISVTGRIRIAKVAS